MQHAAIEVTMNGETGTVVGFENHSGQTTLGPGAKPFGTIVAGAGNNGRDGTEGAVRDNVYATYLHGPVLPKNPWLTDQLIKIALERRMGSRSSSRRWTTPRRIGPTRWPSPRRCATRVHRPDPGRAGPQPLRKVVDAAERPRPYSPPAPARATSRAAIPVSLASVPSPRNG